MREKLLSNPYTIRGRGRLKIKFFACFNTIALHGAAGLL